MVIPRYAAAAGAAVLFATLVLPTQAVARSVDTGETAATGPSRAATDTPGVPVSWRTTATGSTDEFRGVAAVSRAVAWVSGETGTVLRTTDGGAIWKDVSPRAAAGLALRDIEAFDAQHAVALSIGPGKSSGIFTTNDGGASWTRTFMNRNRSAFYDCMAFSSDGTGLAMSDPVNGHFRLVISHDRGQSWHLLIPDRMPMALPGEFAFAASGTCIVAGPQHQFWMASGGNHPRVFHTYDAGHTWTVTKTPIRSGSTAGIYSIAFRGSLHGVAVGGDFLKPGAGAHAAATSYDGGRTWIRSGRPVAGYRSGVDFVGSTKLVVAVGPTGSDLSRSGGARWYHFDDARYDAISCTRDGACWGSGTDGRVSVLRH